METHDIHHGSVFPVERASGTRHGLFHEIYTPWDTQRVMPCGRPDDATKRAFVLWGTLWDVQVVYLVFVFSSIVSFRFTIS